MSNAGAPTPGSGGGVNRTATSLADAPRELVVGPAAATADAISRPANTAAPTPSRRTSAKHIT